MEQKKNKHGCSWLGHCRLRRASRPPFHPQCLPLGLCDRRGGGSSTSPFKPPDIVPEEEPRVDSFFPERFAE